MEPSISICSQKDLNNVWELINECSNWLSSKGLNHWKEYYTPEIIKEKFEELEMFKLSTELEKLVGVVCIGQKAPDYYTEKDLENYSATNNSAIYMSMMAVHPKYQKNGYGSKLIQFTEDYAREKNYRSIIIDVLTEYDELNNFYKKRGFNFIGSRTDEDGEEMSFYKKEIN